MRGGEWLNVMTMERGGSYKRDAGDGEGEGEGHFSARDFEALRLRY